MSDFKYTLPLFKVDEDGDLSFRHYYLSNIIPQLNSTIVYMIENEDGTNYERRIYYKVVDILYPTVKHSDNSIMEFDSPVLHCEIIVDEPVNN